MKENYFLKPNLKGFFSLRLASKKGDKLLSLYWFAMLVIVAVGVVLMVNAFYGNPYDIRQVESQTLASHVADCVYFGGKVNPEIFSVDGIFKESFRDQFMNICTLNFSVEGEFTPVPYYLDVEFLSGSNFDQNQFEITEGNLNIKSDCNVTVADTTKLAKCSDKQFLMETDSGQIYLVKILSVVDKTDENTN